ncbi:MAG: D-alanine--D-alanine ligase [Actinomycetia bacterium]|nr:D-alanine--D-alanine ligase [Actinomycetes bacterium]
MGGPSGEHAVSLASGRMVAGALTERGYPVIPVVVGRDGRWRREAPGAHVGADLRPEHTQTVRRRLDETIEGLGLLRDAEVVFLALHGPYGEDGTIQGLLEMVGMPYTGSGPLASALAMDKQMAKTVLAAAGLRVPRGLLLTAAELQDPAAAAARVDRELSWPVVVKPNRGGSSLGAALVDDPEALATALREALGQDRAVLVEERLQGIEVTGAVLEDEDGGVEALPLVEIVPRVGAFFDFDAKYRPGGAEEIVPARVEAEVEQRLRAACIAAHRALGCRGLSRTDLFWTAAGPVVLEVNTIPGLTPASLVPKAARAAGIAFADLVERLVRLAWRGG